jgi:Zn-finger nucleic acid-binding protein
MFCPGCLNQPLRANRLDTGLPVNDCAHCQGMLIPLTAYRDWADRLAGDGSSAVKWSADELAASQDSKRVLSCPKCTRLMVKYRVSADTENRLDFCRHCDEIWLDGGEWSLLAAKDFCRQLLAILSDQWQQDIHQAELRERQARRLEANLGPADAREVQRFLDWLKDHPNRATILGYLNQQD